jgi:hypothetical protein
MASWLHYGRKHLVPVRDLMKHDAIQEPAEAEEKRRVTRRLYRILVLASGLSWLFRGTDVSVAAAPLPADALRE